jgi:hypothetical protein
MHHSKCRFALLTSVIVLSACGGGELGSEGNNPSLEVTGTSHANPSQFASDAELDISDLFAAGADAVDSFQGADVAEIAEEAVNDAIEQDPEVRRAALAQKKTASIARLPMAVGDFSRIGTPYPTSHEGIPYGVPGGFSWRLTSRLHAGNNKPAGYRAFTGWGQAFHALDRTNVKGQSLEIRNNQTLTCTKVNGQSQWQVVQRGGIAGAAFSPDFVTNKSVPATVSQQPGSVTRVSFPLGRAYHFWPSQGRVDIPSAPLCGIVVLLEARAVTGNGVPLSASTPAALLIGGGADYWQTRTNPWQGHKTNVAIAAGQIRRVTGQWAWFGLSTASTADLNILRDRGYLN